MSWFLLPADRPDLPRFLMAEVMVMAIANAAMTLMVSVLTFADRAAVPVWESGGLAVDLIPTTVVAVALISLTATPAVRLRVRAGKAPAVGQSNLGRLVRFMPRHLLARTPILCVLSFVLFVPTAVGLLRLAGWEVLPLPAVLALKAAYGALLGAAVCPFVVLPAACRATV